MLVVLGNLLLLTYAHMIEHLGLLTHALYIGRVRVLQV